MAKAIEHWEKIEKDCLCERRSARGQRQRVVRDRLSKAQQRIALLREHDQAAKRAFRALALRLHPDQGGSHAEFIRLKTVYDRAADGWRRRAG